MLDGWFIPLLPLSPALNEAHNATWQRALNPTLSDGHMTASGLLFSPHVRGELPLANHNSTSGSQVPLREDPKDSGLFPQLTEETLLSVLLTLSLSYTQIFLYLFLSMGGKLWSGHAMRYIHTAGEHCNEHLCQSSHRCPATIHCLTYTSGRS